MIDDVYVFGMLFDEVVLVCFLVGDFEVVFDCFGVMLVCIDDIDGVWFVVWVLNV